MMQTAVRQPTPISADRAEINLYLESLLYGHRQPAGQRVFEAMSYAVLGSAQRIRPILSLRIARLLGSPLNLTLAAAGSVELLHCASLIVDDLPCMDNSPFRRDLPSVHMEFGESTAILAAFALVALAARSVLETPCEPMYRARVIEFQIDLLRSLDCCGLIAGQAMDLENAAANGHRADLAVSDLKTVPLFTLAVEAGSLLPIQNQNVRTLLSGFGREFGQAFQMSDDLLDGEEDNMPAFQKKVTCLKHLAAYFAHATDLEVLIDYLNDRVASPKNCAQNCSQ